MHTLAVVIPAFKEKYFDSALLSLVQQTNKQFTVYIGDDNSPYDLKKIVNKYAGHLDIKYTRFDNNIGAKDIVSQWERCVNLIQNEEWIWLFSDDDIADITCVENFYKLIQSHPGTIDVCRFNTRTINKEGKLISDAPVGPAFESAEEMAYNLLLGQRGNSMPDHIFSKNIYQKTGGFVNTAFAQAADWATSMKFAQRRGIYIIPEAKLNWRYSGDNISSLAGKNNKMLQGYLEFIKWLLSHFKYLSASNKVSYQEMKEAAFNNLKTIIIIHYKGLSFYNYLKMYLFLRKEFGANSFRSILFIFSIIKNSSK